VRAGDPLDPHADLIVSRKGIYSRYLNVGTDESVGRPLSFAREAAAASSALHG